MGTEDIPVMAGPRLCRQVHVALLRLGRNSALLLEGRKRKEGCGADKVESRTTRKDSESPQWWVAKGYLKSGDA